jgi:uncharacterized protein involved in type VI secretion and phage assembly
MNKTEDEIVRQSTIRYTDSDYEPIWRDGAEWGIIYAVEKIEDLLKDMLGYKDSEEIRYRIEQEIAIPTHYCTMLRKNIPKHCCHSCPEIGDCADSVIYKNN